MCDTDWLLRRSRVVEPDQGAAVDSLAKNGKVPLQRLGIEGVRREVQLLRNIGFDACGSRTADGSEGVIARAFWMNANGSRRSRSLREFKSSAV